LHLIAGIAQSLPERDTAPTVLGNSILVKLKQAGRMSVGSGSEPVIGAGLA
jgi:hypothetical protein